MRDPMAPTINGYDCSGIVNRYSFRCEPYYENGNNGGMLLDGSTVHDVLAAKVRVSWEMNSLSAEQYAALTNALSSGESPDTVNAYFFDPSCNSIRLAKFHATRPVFNFAFNNGRPMSFAGAVLSLEEASPLARFVITPPYAREYFLNDLLNLYGFSVASYDGNGVPSDITALCATVPANGDILPRAGTVAISVLYDGIEIGAFPVSVAANYRPVAVGGWWTLYPDGLLDVYCVGDMPDYDSGEWANDNWDGYKGQIVRVVLKSGVTSIAYSVFSGCPALESVAIPDSVTSIGYEAFLSCASLTSVTIPESVASIGSSVFGDCSALESATILSGAVTDSGIGGVFPDCENLSALTFGGGVRSVGGFEWADVCPNLKNVTIGNGVTSIDNGAFYGRSSLESVVIGDTVASIGNYAFSGCANLTSVTIGGGVTSIGSVAFSGCSGLTSVAIPDSVTSVGKEAFFRCDSLTNVTIGDSVTSIGDSAFYECSALASVTIPDSLTSLGSYAFYRCSALRSVIIPGSVASIEQLTFGGCSALESVAIGRGVRSIGGHAFSGCASLTSVTIPDSVTAIGARAFQDCDSLTSVTIPYGVASIGDYAFYDCDSLTSVTIPEGVTSIGRAAFFSCSALASVTIPESVTSIGDSAFSSCNSLTDAYYAGSAAQWKSISGTSYLFPAGTTIHYNSVGPS